MKKFLSRVKSTKGVNGVIVALLLILVGVGAVAGIKTFMDNSKDTVITSTNAKISTLTASDTSDSSN
jgi:hypothetical protein